MSNIALYASRVNIFKGFTFGYITIFGNNIFITSSKHHLYITCKVFIKIKMYLDVIIPCDVVMHIITYVRIPDEQNTHTRTHA